MASSTSAAALDVVVTTTTATTATTLGRRPDNLDLFDPSHSALLLSLTSKKHRQGLLSRHGTGGTTSQSMSGGSSTLSSSSFAAPTSFAHRQLSKLGWTPGAALGRDHGKDGRIAESGTDLALRRDGDEAGLGHGSKSRSSCGTSTSAPPHGEWWKDALGSTLAKLGSHKGSSNRSQEDGSRKQRKDKKKEKKDRKRKRHGEETDSDDADTKPGAAQPQPPPMVRHYTDEELFARTGGSRFGMRASPKARKLAKWRRTKDELGSGGVSDDPQPGSASAGAGNGAKDEDGAAEGALPTPRGPKTRKDKKQRREEPGAAASGVTDGPPSTTSASEYGAESGRGDRAANTEKKRKKEKKSGDDEARRSKKKKRKRKEAKE